jgi:hypothetical protein
MSSATGQRHKAKVPINKCELCAINGHTCTCASPPVKLPDVLSISRRRVLNFNGLSVGRVKLQQTQVHIVVVLLTQTVFPYPYCRLITFELFKFFFCFLQAVGDCRWFYNRHAFAGLFFHALPIGPKNVQCP